MRRFRDPTELPLSPDERFAFPGVRHAIRRMRRERRGPGGGGPGGREGDGPGPGGSGFGPPDGPPFRGWRWRGRARRGDIRMALLALLVERPMHGYEMLRELEQRSGAMWRPSAGSVYPTLQLLEDEALIKGVDVDGRRTYSITEAGKAELKTRKREREREGGREGMPWESAREDSARELREAALSVSEAALQVARVATEDQVKRALEILHDARRRLYALLAEKT